MNNQKEIKKNETKGRGLFYGVIAIATLIIMTIGATFAYFTATTNSTNSAVTTGSTTLKLEYISYEAAWMNDDLIPADTEVVEYSFEQQDDTTGNYEQEGTNNSLCKDDYDNSICSVYVFQVSNTANSPQTVSLNVISEENSFSNLNAMAYEIKIGDQSNYDSTTEENINNHKNDPTFKNDAEDQEETHIQVVDGDGNPKYQGTYTPIYVNRKGVTKTLLKYTEREAEQKKSIDRPLVVITEENQSSEVSERTAKIADGVVIESEETKTFALVLYIKNLEEDQTATDAAKSFRGQMVVSSGDGSTGVSGSISTIQRENLQSTKMMG